MVSGGRATRLAGTVASTRLPPHGDAVAPYVTLLRTAKSDELAAAHGRRRSCRRRRHEAACQSDGAKLIH
jgi:hypothetical protein